ncbi:amidase [Mycobacteroides salmoniphilum]|uniref:amidase n=1 Tax=Mycobacteroides salmoniphilum TaxID=404941 RepID=UPI0035695626
MGGAGTGDVDRRTLLIGTAAAVAAGALSAGCAAAHILPAGPDINVESPYFASLLDISDALQARQFSSVELTHAMLDRIDRLQPSLHAYVTVTADLALAQAARADREIAQGVSRGPLHGVPLAVKDLCRTNGIATTAGMPIYAYYLPAYDATVVSRLKDAGAVLLGKLAMTEGASGEHAPGVIPPVNPWNRDHWVGASSSGSGVATAAGLCFGALGSDTTGSIRYPCAANGLTGLKPTWGRVSRYGVFPLAESLDHVGPMTRSAADAAAILRAIAGHDRNDPTTLTTEVPDYLATLGPRLDGLRIGIDPAYNETGADPATIAMISDVCRTLKRLGAQVKDIRVPDASELITAGVASCAAEAAIAHASTYPARAKEYGALAKLLDVGRAATGVEVMTAQHARLSFTGALAVLFTDIDLLLTPTQPPSNLTIARINQLWATPEGTALMWRFTEPFNMSGNPSITLPGGFTADGLPLTFQLVARHADEALLFRAGHAYQQVTNWHKHHPVL